MTNEVLVKKLKTINFYHSAIKFLEMSVLDEKRLIEQELKSIGMEIEVCDKCLGGTGNDKCSKCHGAGYMAVRID